MKKKFLSKFIHELLLTFLWAFSASAIGQNITVNGNVQDEKGEPIIGATIQLKGSSIGTITNIDRVPIKNSSIPGIIYGMTIGLNYKNIDFSAFLQGLGKYSTFSGVTQNVYEYTYKGTFYDYHLKAWTPERYANGEKITYPALSTHSNTNHVGNDFFIIDRSFTRLKNLQIGYTLSQNILRKIGLGYVRIYYSGDNLFTWTSYPLTHIDPEQNDPIGYPITKQHIINALNICV